VRLDPRMHGGQGGHEAQAGLVGTMAEKGMHLWTYMSVLTKFVP
jgi:hypothetical protein